MKKYYIKERNNPQLGIYYIKLGQISKAEAKRNEQSLYGDNYILSYDTEDEYNKAIDDLVKRGERVQ